MLSCSSFKSRVFAHWGFGSSRAFLVMHLFIALYAIDSSTGFSCVMYVLYIRVAVQGAFDAIGFATIAI